MHSSCNYKYLKLQIYVESVKFLTKGYLPISLVMPLKLQEIIDSVKETLIKTNPDYDIMTKILHLYYDMKLVTFRIDRKMNLIMQFLIFVQLYTYQPLILHQLETVPVPTIDRNTEADSYTELQIKKPYLALNSEMYISIQQKELVTCKRIGYEFYCKELFVVRHKSIQSCESTIYFDLDKDTIKRNCNIIFHYNKSDITLTVLYGSNKIIIANWPNDKHIFAL